MYGSIKELIGKNREYLFFLGAYMLIVIIFMVYCEPLNTIKTVSVVLDSIIASVLFYALLRWTKMIRYDKTDGLWKHSLFLKIKNVAYIILYVYMLFSGILGGGLTLLVLRNFEGLALFLPSVVSSYFLLYRWKLHPLKIYGNQFCQKHENRKWLLLAFSMWTIVASQLAITGVPQPAYAEDWIFVGVIVMIHLFVLFILVLMYKAERRLLPEENRKL